MKIFIKVKPNARENKVEEIGKNQFVVKVKAPPKENKANEEVIKTLAEYFGVPKSHVEILTGFHSGQKIVNIKERKL